MVTKVAITIIKHGILTFDGIKFFIREIIMLEQINTNDVARPIARPFIAALVTARVGHIPISNLKMGFSLHKPLVKSFNKVIKTHPRKPGKPSQWYF